MLTSDPLVTPQGVEILRLLGTFGSSDFYGRGEQHLIMILTLLAEGYIPVVLFLFYFEDQLDLTEIVIIDIFFLSVAVSFSFFGVILVAMHRYLSRVIHDLDCWE